MTAPRVFYVPNEREGRLQDGFRIALAQLQRAGLIADFKISSLQLHLMRASSRQSRAQVRQDLVASIGRFNPDILLLSHLSGTHLTERHLTTIRETTDAFIIYLEGDPYSRWKHPLPREARAAGRIADVVFTVGRGTFADNFRRAGAKDVRWTPSTYYGQPTPPSGLADMRGSEFDIVMIANRNTPRLRGLPGWRQRIELVQLMQREFGSRFAIYGHGWEGPSARGPIPYRDQHLAIQSAWLTANWDHFPTEAWYFSDRLAITLAAGSIHLATEHPGYDEFFGEQRFLKSASDFEAIPELARSVLEKMPVPDRLGAIEDGKIFAKTHLQQNMQLVNLLNSSMFHIDVASAARCFRSGTV